MILLSSVVLVVINVTAVSACKVIFKLNILKKRKVGKRLVYRKRYSEIKPHKNKYKTLF